MKRREFVQSLVVVSGGFLLSTNPVLGAGNKKKRKGTVHANGKKLVNVSVSDGINVVQTDKKGRFELPYQEKARFIYISIPAGYDFPQENGLARHYYSLADKNNSDFDFKLTPLATDDNNHKFIIWADPQVKNAKDVEIMMQESVPDVQKLLKTFPSGTLVHGIGVGDLVWDSHELFPKYNEAVAAMNIPFFQAIGNHDMDYRQGGDETSDKTFQKFYGPSYYSFNRGKVHYVVLDDVRYLGNEREYDGYISQVQLDWLKKDLEFVSKDKLVILNVHIPVAKGVTNKLELYKILKGYKVHIMSGHTHYNQNTIEEGIYEHNHGTVCGAWWTGPICSDGAPAGYGVYDVDGTNLTWYYKATGRDASYQISLHITELTNQKRLIANVWNWDPTWKVEWFADNQLMGELENSVGFDPVAIRQFTGDKLPARRPFVEATKTDHLFVAHFKPDVKIIKVAVTDSFGNKYESAVSA